MDRAQVMAWVDGYERAWRGNDAPAVETLFEPDASYFRSPYEKPLVGHDAIEAIWREDEGEVFTMDARPVAVEGNDAVVRLLVRYGQPVRQEYQDLWVLRFGDDGRVVSFEEWPYWPGEPYQAGR
jgi:ketosteroid isomerase-like protein